MDLEQVSFERFLIDDPEKLRIKTENVIHELTEVQVRQVDQNLSRLRKRMLANSAMATLSLLRAIQSGWLTLPVALLAALQGVKDYIHYQGQKNENPAFFSWKVLNRKR